MKCIGDECHDAPQPAGQAARPMRRGRLAVYCAVGAACSGLGYGLASLPSDDGPRHLAAIAPPVVTVSEIASE